MIKFRYVFKHKETGKIEFQYFTLEQIECGAVMLLLPYEIIARDRYIEMKDRNGREIYENDIDNLGYTISYIGGDNASCGLDLGWYLQRGNFESYTIIEYRSENKMSYNVLEIKGTIYDDKGAVKIEDTRFLKDEVRIEVEFQKFDVINKNGNLYNSASNIALEQVMRDKSKYPFAIESNRLK